MITLRPYQQQAVDVTVDWIRRSLLPCCVEMSVGAGKSIYIAEVARIIHDMSGKRILCIAPRAELVMQNAAKFQLLCGLCSIYSASAGQKSLRHPVVFATPGTFKSVAERLGGEFAAVVIDECEGTTPTIIAIIESMKKGNPNLRVIGTTGTPFTTQNGYIYATDETGRAMDPIQARDPYYHKLLFKITTRELINDDFLTMPIVGATGQDSYAALEMSPNRGGNFDPKDVDRVFVGHGRKTALIVADAMQRMQGRKAIVFFAATLKHADEILASLNASFAAVISGQTKDRGDILQRFAAGRLRVLVNVNVLTVGWDCPSVDGIVLMRATESPRLLTQIIGRALRKHPGKEDALILDYAQNIERHAPDGDVFALQIRPARSEGIAEPIECRCEACGRICLFSPRPNPDGYDIDEHGYFADLDGERIMVETMTGQMVGMPAHYGRRCQHVDMHTEERCGYYWSCKECPICEHKNDIAARFCQSCRCELVNPNDKLVEMHQKLKKDPTRPQCDAVESIEYMPSMSQAGNKMLVASVTTAYRKFDVYLMESPQYQAQADAKRAFSDATGGFLRLPKSISYVKEGAFYKVLCFDEQTDDERKEEKQRWLKTQAKT